MMGMMEPSVPPIPFCMAAIVCSVDNEPAIPNPMETTKKAIKGCNYMTEIRVTRTTMAMPIRSQMLIGISVACRAKLEKADQYSKSYPDKTLAKRIKN